MIRLAKRFDFDAAHSLPNLPDGHKCRREHGHTYQVEIVCSDELRSVEKGMLLDYAEVAAAWAPIHELIDHRRLNDISGLDNPTTEVLAKWIYDRLDHGRFSDYLDSVKVFESATTWCEYRPGTSL